MLTSNQFVTIQSIIFLRGALYFNAAPITNSLNLWMNFCWDVGTFDQYIEVEVIETIQLGTIVILLSV